MKNGTLGWDVPPAWSCVPFQTIIEVLAAADERHPDAAAMIFEDGLIVTAADLRERVEEFAGYIRERIQPGERVAIMLSNRAEFMVAWLAVVACRGVLVSINPSAGPHDAGHILRDSRSVIAIAGNDASERLAAGRSEFPDLREVIGVHDPEPDGLRGYRGVHGPLRLRDSAAERSDIANIYYTSGTTGLPKGCMLDHEYWLRVVDVDLRLHPKTEDDRILCCLQFFYNDPAWQLLAGLITGAPLIVMRRFSVSRFWDVVRRCGVTEILAIASMPILLLKAPPGPQDRQHRVKRALQVAVPANLHRELNDRWGFPWIDGYGITEGGFVTRVPLQLAEELVGSGSIGVACPDVELRLVNELGVDVPLGEVGEFLMRAPGMMRGYFNQPQLSAATIGDGWLHTGDLGRADERGLFYFVGRKKDIIRRSGENVSASEVEAVLRAHPMVLEVAVIAVPDPLRGEEIKAFVQPIAGETIDTLPPSELVSFCVERLAPFKVPRYFEYRTEDFARTPSMRVRKEVLRGDGADLTKRIWDREQEMEPSVRQRGRSL